MTDPYPHEPGETERPQGPASQTDGSSSIERDLPTDEDGERIYPQGAPREGEDPAQPSATGTVEERDEPVPPPII
jgi:hypothetical protein